MHPMFRSHMTYANVTARPLTPILALLAIVAALAGRAEGKMTKADRAIPFPVPPSYSVSTAKLDRELACKGGTEELSGEGENDPVLLVPGTRSPASRIGDRTTGRASRSWLRGLLGAGAGHLAWRHPDLGGVRSARGRGHARGDRRANRRAWDTAWVASRHAGSSSGSRRVPSWTICIALASPNHGGALGDQETAGGKAPEFTWQLRTDANFHRRSEPRRRVARTGGLHQHLFEDRRAPAVGDHTTC